MTKIELHAAGIEDERLRESYRYCRRLNAQHGRTYFLATRLLTPSQQCGRSTALLFVYKKPKRARRCRGRP